MIRLAFDIGGTFTDLVLQDVSTKRIVVHKTPTTPADLRRAVMDGLAQLLDRAEAEAASVSSVFHATTIATNAVLERKGVQAGLLTTRGFRDVVFLGRQKRYDTYDMYMDKPEPLTRRRHVFEVDERGRRRRSPGRTRARDQCFPVVPSIGQNPRVRTGQHDTRQCLRKTDRRELPERPGSLVEGIRVHP
jgi:N-methylhydantoinase A/oxoprolinase/acetone carboxylase beta subunit